MRRGSLALFSLACASSVSAAVWAQAAPAATPRPRSVAAEAAQTSAAVKDLPVRKVVLYKNGVGYFEHAGLLNGTQKVSIDFTSSQLNDVLQSLTILDEGGGRIGGVNYNSATPMEQQLNLVGLGLKEFPATIAVYQAFRGQRVEVTGAGAAIAGRLVNIEFRKQTDKNGSSSEDHYFLIVASDAGALRTVELTDAVSVRMLDATKQKQLSDYLRVLAGAADQQARHVTFEDAGQGQRAVRVSYISEVPVWKSTYRIVFPKDPNGKATLQGWAVVDNTVGADWENVQLALIAGAPQSFIQPLSQPLYTHRPEIPIAVDQQLRPTTHAAAEMHTGTVQSEMMNAQQSSLGRLPSGLAMRVKAAAPPVASFGVAGMEGLGGSAANAADGIGLGSGMGSGSGYGVFRPSDAGTDVATKAFDDFFEYTLSQPVTIHKNESAMVPILQQDLPAEHVTLWSEREPRPLRAVWLENASKLTLDQGSFSIYESGEFAGEGLLDPVHPGERRLLSYAADQAVNVRVEDRREGKHLHHVSVQKGAVIETTMDESTVIYAVTNSSDVTRAVLIETPRKSGLWTLDESLKPEETAANLYRFKVGVNGHGTARLEVRQHGPEETRVELAADEDQSEYLLELMHRVPAASEALKPVLEAQSTIAKLQSALDEQKQIENKATEDESRVRENLAALKGNDASRRFVEALNRAEDAIEGARKRQKELEAQKQTAVDKLATQISALNYDWKVEVSK